MSTNRRIIIIFLAVVFILHCGCLGGGGSFFALGLAIPPDNDVANEDEENSNSNAEANSITTIPIINPTQSPHVSPPPTHVPSNDNTTTTAPTPHDDEKNTTTIAPSTKQPHNDTTIAPTMHPSKEPVTSAPIVTHAPTTKPSVSPSAAPTTFTPPPRPSSHGGVHGILQILGRTIAWMILLFLATIAFGGIMQNRYRIYYFLRGCWYTLLSLSCTRWIMAKLRLSDYFRNRGVDDSLNTILFENELNEGLLMRETDT